MADLDSELGSLTSCGGKENGQMQENKRHISHQRVRTDEHRAFHKIVAVVKFRAGHIAQWWALSWHA